MSDRPDLAALLAEPCSALSVPRETVPDLLDALAVQEGRARLLRELLTGRLTETRPRPPGRRTRRC